MFESSTLRSDQVATLRIAEEIFTVNRQLHGAEAQALLQDPVTAITYLLNRVAVLEGKLTLATQNVLHLEELAKKMDQRTAKAQQLADDLIAHTAEVQAKTKALQRVLDPLRKVVEHSNTCVVGDICKGHEHTAALAKAINEFVSEAK